MSESEKRFLCHPEKLFLAVIADERYHRPDLSYRRIVEAKSQQPICVRVSDYREMIKLIKCELSYPPKMESLTTVDVIFRPYLNFYCSKPPDKKCVMKDQDLKKRRKVKDLVPKNLEDDVPIKDPNVTITGPTEIDIRLLRKETEDLRDRTARIAKPAKNCMQSGTNNLHLWQLKFDTKEQWENPCIGYTSTGDPISNLLLTFSTKEEATDFCKKNNWKCITVETPTKKMFKKRTYADNFVYNKRTRVSTK